MKKVKVKANAKINLTLDIGGVEKGFHNLKSLVASVDLSDAITLSKRKDDLITLKIKGLNVPCEKEENTAYLAGKAFKEKFNTCGVDIAIDKRIFLGGGLGGSSADIAGVLNGLKKLFDIKDDVKDLADSLGSDSGYMLSGGYAVISGRGERVEKIDASATLYISIVKPNALVLAKDSYAEYDRQKIVSEGVTDKAKNLLIKGDIDGLIQVIKNDLYLPSIAIAPEIKQVAEKLSGIKKTVMTGSGSCLYIISKTKKEQRDINKKLKRLGFKITSTKTI